LILDLVWKSKRKAKRIEKAAKETLKQERLEAERELLASQTEKDDPKFIQQSCFSFTKKNGYHLTVPKHLIEGKRVILLDDF
ncbi:hypothetical protein PT115_09325, partial [Erysipelothrix rhusiopathiae]|nr:hypothetical protein [Erysipelothrix rhusiopathiae]